MHEPKTLPKFLTTRDIMDGTGIQTTAGAIKFILRENLGRKIGGRYRVSRQKLAAHWPDIIDELLTIVSESNERAKRNE